MTLLLKLWIVFWPCDDCYSLSNSCYTSGFCSLLNFIFCLKLPCITIYKLTQTWIKHPCSTRDLGPLHPSFLIRLLPWSKETCELTILPGLSGPPWEDALYLRVRYKPYSRALSVFHVTQGILVYPLLSFHGLWSTRP